jgi:predicted phosphoribosyltransferase
MPWERAAFSEPHLMVYSDRRHAGRELAGLLEHLENRPDVIVLALPRGGVPVAYEVACAIKAPLDVFLVRKLGVPGQPELAMGAIATGGVRVINDDLVRALRISDSTMDAIAAAEGAELERRERLYRAGHHRIALHDRTVVLVDDGLATGATMKAAVQAIRADAPARVVVAAPVGAAETCVAIAAIADEVVCGCSPVDFRAVGQWYEDFSQTTDDEVKQLLAQANRRASRP